MGVDLPPTIYQYAGLKTPWAMHGRDLSSILQNPEKPWPHPMMMVATGRKFGSDTNVIPPGRGAYHDGVPWYAMLRVKNLKYVRPLVPDLEELYDLDRDPEELDNLAVKNAHRATLLRMRVGTVAELKRTGAGFVDRMPAVREAAG
jgi:arylsulfatase A-like enzyme